MPNYQKVPHVLKKEGSSIILERRCLSSDYRNEVTSRINLSRLQNIAALDSYQTGRHAVHDAVVVAHHHTRKSIKSIFHSLDRGESILFTTSTRPFFRKK